MKERLVCTFHFLFVISVWYTWLVHIEGKLDQMFACVRCLDRPDFFLSFVTASWEAVPLVMVTFPLWLANLDGTLSSFKWSSQLVGNRTPSKFLIYVFEYQMCTLVTMGGLAVSCLLIPCSKPLLGSAPQPEPQAGWVGKSEMPKIWWWLWFLHTSHVPGQVLCASDAFSHFKPQNSDEKWPWLSTSFFCMSTFSFPWPLPCFFSPSLLLSLLPFHWMGFLRPAGLQRSGKHVNSAADFVFLASSVGGQVDDGA